ncbi:MAG: hypothetical protein HC942_26030 [Microcoleus sp. SU_5_6]|nr:hypothetical protein [Microcoleus sp. SU_5_6]NJL67984.1 hypothetical protein [Microcoleus sp. SM1_3_4]
MPSIVTSLIKVSGVIIEGRRKKEEGRGKKEEGRGRELATVNYQLSTINYFKVDRRTSST